MNTMSDPPHLYATSWEHLSDEMKKMDLLLLRQIRSGMSQSSATRSPLHALNGLEEAEVYQLLVPQSSNLDHDEEASTISSEVLRWEAYIAQKIQMTHSTDTFLPLDYLVRLFELSSFERNCMLLALASEWNCKYERLFAYVQNDLTRKQPTIGLALDLFCKTERERMEAWAAFSSEGALVRYLLSMSEEGPLLSRSFTLDGRIRDFLLHTQPLPASKSYLELFLPEEPLELLIDNRLQQQLDRCIQQAQKKNILPEQLVFCLTGKKGSGKLFQIRHFCRRFSVPVLVIQLKELLGTGEMQDFKQRFREACREATLFKTALCLTDVQIVLAHPQVVQTMEEELSIFSGLVFLLATEPLVRYFLKEGSPRMWLAITMPVWTRQKQMELWEYFATSYETEAGITWEYLSSQFDLTPGDMKQTLELASVAVLCDGREKITLADIISSQYSRAEHLLGEKANRITVQHGWGDLILPPDQMEELRHICTRMRHCTTVYEKWGMGRRLAYGRGNSVLFSGPPGTGKTMAAQVLASDLMMELYRIDIPKVVSKYIGETEKNLDNVFEQGKASNAILFFDEADALFGKRSEVKEAKDRYANMEVAYLLQKMEEYEGMTILATNYIRNFDEAFLRRIQSIITFSFPDALQREQIWQSMFPPEVPVSSDLDFCWLGQTLELTGGYIKNIALSAMFFAAEMGEAVAMKHIRQAVRSESKKTGIASTEHW